MDRSQGHSEFPAEKGHNGLDSTHDASQQSSDQYVCERCDKTMHSQEKDQHDDWHFAKDLQEQETSEQHGSTGSNLDNPVGPNVGPQATDQPPSYLPPPYPPAKDVPRRAAAVRAHTNQVIMAAEIRARDEVHFTFHPSVISVASANFPTATNAECTAESPIPVSNLQQRDRARARGRLLLLLSYSHVPKHEMESLWSAGYVVKGRYVSRLV